MLPPGIDTRVYTDDEPYWERIEPNKPDYDKPHPLSYRCRIRPAKVVKQPLGISVLGLSGLYLRIPDLLQSNVPPPDQ